MTVFPLMLMLMLMLMLLIVIVIVRLQPNMITSRSKPVLPAPIFLLVALRSHPHPHSTGLTSQVGIIIGWKPMPRRRSQTGAAKVIDCSVEGFARSGVLTTTSLTSDLTKGWRMRLR